MPGADGGEGRGLAGGTCLAPLAAGPPRGAVGFKEAMAAPPRTCGEGISCFLSSGSNARPSHFRDETWDPALPPGGPTKAIDTAVRAIQ